MCNFFRSIIILSFFVGAIAFWASAPKAHAAQCSETERQRVVQRAVETRDTILENFKERDVEEEVNRFKAYVAKCDLNIARFGFGRGIYDFWLKRGWEAEADKWKEKAEYYANFRDVSKELGNYRGYALKAGERRSRVNSYFSEQRVRGHTSARREQNSCTPVDLRGPKLGPVRDQDTMAWCYAHAAADIISYRTGKVVSAFGIALSYNGKYHSKYKRNILDFLLGRDGEFVSENKLEYGWATKAISAANESGYCLERDLPSEDNGFGEIYAGLRDLEEFKGNFSSNNSSPGSKSCDSIYPNAQSMFPNLDLENFIDVVESSSRDTFLRELSKLTCKEKIDTEFETYKSGYADDLDERLSLFDIIDAQLNEKNPVILTYNPKVLRNMNERVAGSYHSSTVVGRRYNADNGECEFLIRNSYGRNCGGYDKRLECDEGNIWVPKSSLGRVTTNVEYIK